MTALHSTIPDSLTTLDEAGLAGLFATQCGAVTRTQLLELGFSSSFIRRKLRRGEWARHLPGVYVNHNGPLTWDQRCWIAVLSTEPSALGLGSALRAAGSRSALVVGNGPIDVVVDEKRSLPPRPGVRVHYRSQLDEQVLPHARPPRQRPEHAFLEVAAAASDEAAAIAALTEAVGSRLTTVPRLVAALESRPSLPHRRFLRTILDDVAAGTCSVLEHRYLTQVERPHMLPTPIRQAPIAHGRPGLRDLEYEWDLIVELDGRLGHDDPASRRRDFERDLEAAVYERKRTVRLCFAQATVAACTTATRIGTLLNQGGWTGHAAPCSPTCPAASRRP